MGGTCAKGSKTQDPDKTPYARAQPDGQEADTRGSKRKKGSKKDKGKNAEKNAGEGKDTAPVDVEKVESQPNGGNTAEVEVLPSVIADVLPVKDIQGSATAAVAAVKAAVEDGKDAVAQEVAQVLEAVRRKDEEPRPEGVDGRNKENTAPKTSIQDELAKLSASLQDATDATPVKLHIAEEDEKPKPRPSALPKLASPKSPKATTFEEASLDASAIIARVKTQMKDGKYADLVSSPEEASTTAPKSPGAKTSSQSPDRDVSKPESSSQLPRPLGSPKGEPMAILSSLNYLKPSEDKDEPSQEEKKDLLLTREEGRKAPERKMSPHSPRIPHKRPLEPLPEVETSVATFNGTTSPTSPHRESPETSQKIAKLDSESLPPKTSSVANQGEVSEDEDSAAHVDEIDLHIEESPRTKRPLQQPEVEPIKGQLSPSIIVTEPSSVPGQVIRPTSLGTSLIDQIPTIHVEEERSVSSASSKSSLASRSSSRSSSSDAGRESSQDIDVFCRENLPDESSINTSIAARYEFCRGTRSKAVQMVDRFVDGESPCGVDGAPVIMFTGSPGMGKSSLMRELCTMYSLQLAGSYFFSVGCSKLEHNFFRYASLALARTILTRVDSYIDTLPSTAEIRSVIREGSNLEVVDKLILTPFHNNTEFSQRKRLVLVIDAIDECEDRDEIIAFINHFHAQAPPWFILVISARSDSDLVSRIHTTAHMELKANTSDNSQDMQKIIKSVLETKIDKISLNTAVTQLYKKAQGLPLCATLYKQILTELGRNITLREVESLFPAGIEGVVDHTLQKFHKDFQGTQETATAVLSLFALAREPLPWKFFQTLKIKNLDSLKLLSVIADISSKHVHIVHPHIAEVLFSSATRLNYASATAYMAKQCMQWVEPAIADDAKPVAVELSSYAVKHAVSHLIDALGNTEHLEKILCSLEFIRYSLSEKLHSVESLQRLYRHHHCQPTKERKQVTVPAYLAKNQAATEHAEEYRKFLRENSSLLVQYPVCVWQLGANYVSSNRLQQSARADLGKNPWLEDLRGIPETPCMTKPVAASVLTSDVSQDGKYLAIITCDDENILLSIYTVNTLQVVSLDLASVEGRSGLCCRFLADSSAVFVGSLSHLVNTRGEVIHVGFDSASLKIKEQYAIECCDATPFHLVVSLSTFPYSGRSAYLAVYNIKDKSLHTMNEILTFRFGGSANFGVKACAILSSKKLVGACIKETKKAQMKVNIWDISKWNVLHTCVVDCDNINYCQFVKNDRLAFDLGLRQNGRDTSKVCTWAYTSVNNTQRLYMNEYHSVIARGVKTQLIVFSWKFPGSRMVVHDVLLDDSVQGPSYRVQGVEPIEHAMASKTHLVALTGSTVRAYTWTDVKKNLVEEHTKLLDSVFDAVEFLPKSNMALLLHTEESEPGTLSATVYTCEYQNDDFALKETALKGVKVLAKSTCASNNSVFCSSAGKTLLTASDGKHFMLNTGNSIKVGEVTKSTVIDISVPELILTWAVNPKEGNVAVLTENAAKIVFYDVNSGVVMNEISLGELKPEKVQFTVLPTNGNVITFVKSADDNFSVWSSRTGDPIHQVTLSVYFCYVSPSSDRMAVSYKGPFCPELLLRSSDAKFSASLDTRGAWAGTPANCDVVFSDDGTVLAGVDYKSGLCRVWNAGNGEVLRDVAVEYEQKPFIGGMLTNTHVLVYDGRMLVFDVASGVLISAQTVRGDVSRRCMAVAPKGQLLAGILQDNSLMLFKPHNFDPAKRKTTLQRMKSFTS